MSKRRFQLVFFAAMLGFMTPLGVVTAKEITDEEIKGIWKELWGAAKPMPRIEPITDAEVRKRMTGKWVCQYGVGPQKLNITLSKDHKVETSGETEGRPWRKTGEWKVVAGKIILLIKEEQLPGYIFQINKKLFIWDPWSETGMSEVMRQLSEKAPHPGLTPDDSRESPRPAPKTRR